MMKFRKLGLGLALTGLTALPAHGALVISEVVFNEVGSDVTGEWIEIYNNGTLPVSLGNFKIGDEETSGGTSVTEAVHLFPAAASINAGEVQIVAVSATRFFTVYGINPTYEVNATDAGVADMLPYATWDPDGGVINMANTNDQAVLIDGTDTIIDAASWGSSTFAFNPALGAALDGQSYQRINANVDTDTASDWEAVPGATAAERSTPFFAPVPEPTAMAGLLFAGVLGFVRRRK